MNERPLTLKELTVWSQGGKSEIWRRSMNRVWSTRWDHWSYIGGYQLYTLPWSSLRFKWLWLLFSVFHLELNSTTVNWVYYMQDTVLGAMEDTQKHSLCFLCCLLFNYFVCVCLVWTVGFLSVYLFKTYVSRTSFVSSTKEDSMMSRYLFFRCSQSSRKDFKNNVYKTVR